MSATSEFYSHSSRIPPLTRDMSKAIPNADPHELDKFAHLAERWWDPEGPFKPLHQLNPLRLDYVKTTVGSLTGKRLVDIGCGGGIFSESLAREGAEVTGIDLTSPVIDVARLHQREHTTALNLEYRLQSSTDLLETEAASFDIVTCMEMLEHVPDPAQTIQECAELVKPGGWVFFSTINRTNMAYFVAIVGAEYVLKMLPRGTHDYSKFIRPSELAESARQARLDLYSLRGLRYTPWNSRFTWTSDTSVNYLMAFQRLPQNPVR